MLAFFLLLRKEDGGHGQLVHEKLQLVTALQLNTAVVIGCAVANAANLVTLAVAPAVERKKSANQSEISSESVTSATDGSTTCR